MDQQNSSSLKFFDPVILRKSAIIDDGFALDNSFLPLPSIVELVTEPVLSARGVTPTIRMLKTL